VTEPSLLSLSLRWVVSDFLSPRLSRPGTIRSLGPSFTVDNAIPSYLGDPVQVFRGLLTTRFTLIQGAAGATIRFTFTLLNRYLWVAA